MKPRKCLYAELPCVAYEEAWALQSRIVAVRKERLIEMDVILILEHPPVFTLGRRGGAENLRVSEAFLERSGIPVVHVERGGNITYHGPGQLVGYPIMLLREARLSVVGYVERLEEVMIRTAADVGVHAERNPINRGVWVGTNKLGSVGIAVRRGICFHGFALNVNLSLEPFSWINPCGLHGIGVTSLARELSQELSMEEIRGIARRHVEDVLEVELVPAGLSEIAGSPQNHHHPIPLHLQDNHRLPPLNELPL